MIVVGLGNPGKQYEKTVHNVGFMAIDRLSDKLGIKLKEKGCGALYGVCYARGEKIVVAKPQTFMNLSGESVKQLVRAEKVGTEDVVIVYDDVDLPLGTIRIRAEGSAGTHNGMRNIVALLGTTAIARIRIGVGDDRGKMELRDYVLSSVSGEKKEKLNVVLDRAADCLAEYVEHKDLDAVMRKYNGKVIE